MFIQEDHFKNIFNTVREALLILDENMRVLSANRSFFRIFKVDSANTIGSLLFDLGNGQWNIPILRVLLEDVLPKNDTVDDYEIEHAFESIGRKTMLLNACKLREKNDDRPIILLAIEDITERREIEKGLEKARKELEVTKISADEAREYAESIINTVREPLIALDQNLVVVSASRSFYEVFKVKPEETVGQLIYDLGNKQWDIPKLRDLLETILPQQATFDNYEVDHEFSAIGRRIMLLNARQIHRVWGKKLIILLAIEDITERKRLEDLLADSEMQYRRLFETASDGIVLLEKNKGHIVQANPAAGKMLGYSEEEYTGKMLSDIGVSLDTSDFTAIVRELSRNGILNYEDVPVRTKSGEYIDTDIYMVDRAKLAQCNIRDITERKRSAAILVEEKAFIENALNALQDIFFVFDLEGRFLRWNKTVNAVSGYSDTEIALLRPADLFRNDDIRKITGAIQTAAEKGGASLEAHLVTKDGRQIPYDFSAALLTDAHGKPLGVCGVGRDMTERIKAAGILRESDERFRQIAESTKEWIWEVNREGLFTHSNHVVEEILGYKPEEILGKMYFYDFFPSDKREQIKQDFFKFFDEKKEFIKYVSPNIHKDGSLVLVETSGLPILDNRGDLVGYRGIKVDITGYRKLEEQLRHAQKMEAVGTLAGGIAHDFNNILNVILGYGHMVMDGLAADSPSKENMSEVLIAADRAANLTKRLLVFSRKQVVEVKPVDINQLILGLQKMLVRIVRESIVITVDLADRPLMVMADVGQMEQVLINLAANARDAMLEGGRLTLCTGIQEIDAEYAAAYGYGKPGRYVLITVADTGPGMDAEIQKKIFEPFFTTKDIGEGTGLGLAISYGIIKQHNGYIKVYSEPGHGTAFKIYLPLIEAAAALGIATEAPVSVMGGNETILVSEDDASLRKWSRIVLESHGYCVITAEDGEDAVAKFMENRDRVQLAILDMIMPKKNGKEVSEAIRKVSPRTKILFMSGYTMDIMMPRDITEAGFDFILKPVLPKDLLKKVREVLDT